MSRVVVLVDMDCFYAQVEQRERPELWGRPVGVLQYSANGMSGLIAVSYEARPYGVKRGMTAKQSRELCPEIEICLVPQGEHADKADIQKYRDASAEVFAVLGSTDPRVVLERASVDEAFLDLTAYVESRMRAEERERMVEEVEGDGALGSSHVVEGEGEENECARRDDESEEEWKERRRREGIERFVRLCATDDETLKIGLAAVYAERLRAEILEKTQFYCSAGVGNNKMMAKLVCALHKPRQQSIVVPGRETVVLEGTPIRDIRGLGGKLGRAISEELGITTMGELGRVPLVDLQAAFPGQAEWLRRLARGEDDEPVKARSTQISIGVGKNFPGKLAIGSSDEARHWLNGLVKELEKRLEDDKVKNVVLHLTTDVSVSRTVRVAGITDELSLMTKLWPVMHTMRKGPGDKTWCPPIVNISLSAGKFSEGLPGREASIVAWVERKAKEVESEEAKKELAAAEDPVTDMREAIEDGEGREEEEDDDDVIFIDDDNQPSTSTARGEAPAARRRGYAIDVEGTRFELDEEGWQVWPVEGSKGKGDADSKRKTSNNKDKGGAVPTTKRRGERVKDYGRKTTEAASSSTDVSRDIFCDLPIDIQRELTHYENLRIAKEIKGKQAAKESAKPPTRKRKGKEKANGDGAKTRKLDNFFNKENGKK